MQDLLKSTRRKHKDYRNLSLALDEIVNAATYINEQKRVYEETSKLVSVQQMLSSDYVSRGYDISMTLTLLGHNCTAPKSARRR